MFSRTFRIGIWLVVVWVSASCGSIQSVHIDKGENEIGPITLRARVDKGLLDTVRSVTLEFNTPSSGSGTVSLGAGEISVSGSGRVREYSFGPLGIPPALGDRIDSTWTVEFSRKEEERSAAAEIGHDLEITELGLLDEHNEPLPDHPDLADTKHLRSGHPFKVGAKVKNRSLTDVGHPIQVRLAMNGVPFEWVTKEIGEVFPVHPWKRR